MELAKYHGREHSRSLYSIENAWAYVKRQLQSMTLAFENLEETVITVWNNFSTIFCRICNSGCLQELNSVSEARDTPQNIRMSKYFSNC